MSGGSGRDRIVASLKNPSEGANIVILGTCDSKLQELLLLRQYAIDAGADKVSIIDVGRKPVKHEHITVSQDIVSHYGQGSGDPADMARGDVIKHMIGGATDLMRDVWQAAGIHGVLSAGGSGGTSLTAAVMRDALPIGFPKLIVSTVASGDTGPLVGETDITMTYSVVDIAGTNPLLRAVFANAAGAIVGMAKAYSRTQAALRDEKSTTKKTRVGITMFGVTTACVDACRQYLESKHDYEVYVFHATGHGGKAMERLVEAGELDAVLDITTTEVCDHLMGGNMSAGGNRLEAAAKAGIPYVLSLGATSMVNFGPRGTVPQKYEGRQLYEHNPSVTLMRTNKEECFAVGEFIASKLKMAVKPKNVHLVIPNGGVCLISTPGAPFADPDADMIMFLKIKDDLTDTSVKVLDDHRDINDPGFAEDISQRLVKIINAQQPK